MKMYQIMIVAFSLFIFSALDQLSGPLIMAAGIPVGVLYSDGIRSLGEISNHYPATFTTSRIAEGDVLFGRAVIRVSSVNAAKVIDDPTGMFLGVAARSYDASNFDNDSYSDKDPLGVLENGIVNVYAEKAIDPTLPVRVRHTDQGALLAGSFTDTAEQGATAIIEGARWEQSRSESGACAVLINGPCRLIADI